MLILAASEFGNSEERVIVVICWSPYLLFHFRPQKYTFPRICHGYFLGREINQHRKARKNRKTIFLLLPFLPMFPMDWEMTQKKATRRLPFLSTLRFLAWPLTMPSPPESLSRKNGRIYKRWQNSASVMIWQWPNKRKSVRSLSPVMRKSASATRASSNK